MRTQALTGPLSYSNIRDGLHAYAQAEHLPRETEEHVLSDLVTSLWREAAREGINWQVGASLAEADDGYPIQDVLADVLADVDVHKIVDQYLPHPHYPAYELASPGDRVHYLRHSA